MTDQRDEATLQAAAGVVPHDGAEAPESPSRRAMLRGVTATVPTILSLTSGAALAATSNLISTLPDQTAGDVYCLDPGSTQGQTSNPNVYDLGAPPFGEVTRFPTVNKYRNESSPSQELTPAEACKLDGTVGVKYNGSGPWVAKTRTPGVLVSNAAVTSFGSRIITTDI